VATVKYFTPEARKAAHKRAMKKYMATPKGKALQRKHDGSDRRKESRHGLPVGWYADQRLRQNNLCLICKRELKAGRMVHIDHDHRHCPTRRGCPDCVRGLLCRVCNTGLGDFNDSPDMLRRAADYLEGKWRL